MLFFDSFFFLKNKKRLCIDKEMLGTVKKLNWIIYKPAKMSDTYCKRCRIDLQYQFSTGRKKHFPNRIFFWLSSHVCLTKEYFWHKLYSPDCFFFFFLNLWLTSRKLERFTIHRYITLLDFFSFFFFFKYKNCKK